MGMCLRFPGSLGFGRQDAGKTECVWDVGACFHRGPVPVPQIPVEPTSFLSPRTTVLGCSQVPVG